jgi:hypothetical protein
MRTDGTTNKQHDETASRHSQFCERAQKRQNSSAKKVHQFQQGYEHLFK